MSICILQFQNVLECFSSPKNCHDRKIVIHFVKNIVMSLLRWSVLASSEEYFYKYFLKVFTLKSIKMKFLPNFEDKFIQFIKI